VRTARQGRLASGRAASLFAFGQLETASTNVA